MGRPTAIHPVAAALLALALAASAGAASPAARPSDRGRYEGLPVTLVRILADGPFDRAAVERVIDLHPGSTLTARGLERDIQAILLLDRFDDVVVDARPFLGGVMVSLLLARSWTIDRVRLDRGPALVQAFDLLSPLSRRKVLQQLRLRRGDRFSQSALDEGLARMVEFYERRGFYQARIEPLVERDPVTRAVSLRLQVDEGRPALVESIDFRGPTGLRPHYLRRAMETRVGQRFDAQVLADDRDRLLETYRNARYLDADIRRPETHYDPETNRVQVVVPVRVGPPLEVRLEAPRRPWNWDWTLYRLDPVKLIEILGLPEGTPVSGESLETGARHLERVYQARGFADARVDLTITPPTGLGLPAVAMLRVEEGPRVRVAGVAFPGAGGIDSAELARQILNRTGARFDPGALEDDRLALAAFLAARGYPAARVSEAVVERPAGGRRAELAFAVDPGPRRLVATVQLPPELPLSTGQAAKVVSTAAGDPYSAARLEEERRALEQALRDRGYRDAAVRLATEDEADSGVAVRFETRLGRRHEFDRVIVRGLARSKARVVLREIDFEPGDDYSYRELLLAQRRISQLGLFSEVRLTPLPWEQDEVRQPLLLTVRERPGLVLEAGAGYNSDEGLRGTLLAFTSNLGGYGRYLGASALLDEVQRKASLTFREPYLGSQPNLLELRLYWQEEELDGYWLRARGARAGITRKLTPHFRLLAQYRLGVSKPFQVEPEAEIPPRDRESVQTAALGPSALFDSRDDPRDPHSGLLGSITLERGEPLLGSEQPFWRSEGQLAAFLPAGGRTVLAASLRMGLASDDLPLSERFRLGGLKSIRGFEREEVAGPDDLGGSVAAVVNAELRSPLVWGFGGVAFADAGNVWSRIAEVDRPALKTSVGLGLRYMTPVGPLGLDYAFNFEREPDERASRLVFMIGHAF